jgi:DNA-binding transcriptional LysR family regulator
LDLRHIRYFIAVAEEEHFGRAADRLHIVQPALSMQIKALEKELGGPLFVRTTRRTALTEAGRVFLPEARRVLGQVDNAADLARRSLRGDMGQVRIGFVGNAVLSGVLMEDLRRFRVAHPDAEITLTEAAPPSLRDALVGAELDVAYVSHDTRQNEDLASIPVLSSQIVALMAEDHPLAAQHTLTPSALASERLLLYGTEGDARLSELAGQGFAPAEVLQLASTLSVLAAAAAGLGVALGPTELERLHVPGLVYRPILNFPEEVTLSLLHRRSETSGAVIAFIASAQSVRGKAGDGRR